jgi:hypothetical protein
LGVVHRLIFKNVMFRNPDLFTSSGVCQETLILLGPLSLSANIVGVHESYLKMEIDLVSETLRF